LTSHAFIYLIVLVFFYTLFYIHQIKYNNCGNTRDNEQFEISQENNLSEDNEIEGKNIE